MNCSVKFFEPILIVCAEAADRPAASSAAAPKSVLTRRMAEFLPRAREVRLTGVGPDARMGQDKDA